MIEYSVVLHCVREIRAESILFLSLEVSLNKRGFDILKSLLNHGSSQYCSFAGGPHSAFCDGVEGIKGGGDVLVVGCYLPGHEIPPSSQVWSEVKLTGLNSPWNTCALWDIQVDPTFIIFDLFVILYRKYLLLDFPSFRSQ